MADRHKLTSGMLLLTVFGAVLILPPMVYVFNQRIAIFGIPQIVFYLFVVWLLLILGTALMANIGPERRPETSEPRQGES